MASSDATPLPLKGQALQITRHLWLTTGLINSGAAGLDSEVSKDGGAFADCTNEATEIGSSGSYTLDLTSTEMNADVVVIQIKSSTTDAITDKLTIYPSSLGKMQVDVRSNAGTAITSASGIQEVKVASLAAAAIQSIWDALTSALTTSGSIGKWILDKLDAVVSTRLASSSYTAPPSAATNASAVRTELTTELGRIDAAVSSRLASGSYTAPDNAGIAAIQAVTDALPNAGALTSLATQTSVDDVQTSVDAVPTAVQNADAFLDRNINGGSSSGRKVKDALKASRNKVDVSNGTSVKVYEEDDTTLAWELSITTDPNALPIKTIG